MDMGSVDGGLGALLKIMDCLRQASRDQKKLKEKQELEELAYDEQGRLTDDDKNNFDTIDPTQRRFFLSGCYRKNHGLKGYGYGQAGPALMSADIGERYVHQLLVVSQG